MKLSNTFGMTEMELAAERILKICSTCKEQRFSITSFIDEYEMDGFVELIHNGWLEHGTYNGEFYMSDSFIERIKSKHPDVLPKW